jgi:hypothetical protein
LVFSIPSASVLGVDTREYNVALDDCDRPTKFIQYVTTGGTANLPSGMTSHGYLITLSPVPESSEEFGAYSFQLVFAYNGPEYYIRCSKIISNAITWSAWKQL